MIPFVQPLPPPLHIKLLFIYLFSTDRMGFMTKCSSVGILLQVCGGAFAERPTEAVMRHAIFFFTAVI